jgi:hypothetical protein
MDRLGYYRYLVRTVPPGAVARSAARRAWRAMGARGMRRLVEAIRGDFPGLAAGLPNVAVAPPAAREILAAAGARTPNDLPGILARPLSGPLPLASPAAVAATAAALRRELPREARRALHLAERAHAGRVGIFGEEVVLPRADRAVPFAREGYRAVDWDRDPTGTARFPEGRIPAGADPKRAWAYGRLEEVVHLACGAVLAAPEHPDRSRAFADRALDRLLDFGAAPPGIQWTCPMEVALRAANGAIALRLLAGHPALATRPRALLEVLRSLVFHARFVDAHLEDTGAVANNHLVADLVGLLAVAALLPPVAGLVPTARRPAARLGAELLAQTLPDGMSFEGSVAYHRLAVELFTLGHLLAATAGHPFPERAVTRLGRMFEASRELRDGRGLAPQIGDNDSGRALPFRPRHPLEQAYLLPLGAALFDRAELRLPGAPPSAELVWLLGEEGLSRFTRLPPTPPARDSSLPHGGIHVLRGPRITCAIACGPNGTGGTGGHGHNDKLAVEVVVDGILVVGDPGSPVYTSDPAARDRFRGTFAHSTVAVDGREQQDLPAGRPFALPEQARARTLAFVSGTAASRFAGEHHGYERLSPPVTHRREVLLQRDPEVLLVTDVLAGAGTRRAMARFLTPGGARLRRLARDERRRLALLAPGLDWDVEHAVELGAPGDAPAVLVGAGASAPPRIFAAEYAEGYGESRPAACVGFPLEGELPIVFFSAVVPRQRGRDRGVLVEEEGRC